MKSSVDSQQSGKPRKKWKWSKRILYVFIGLFLFGLIGHTIQYATDSEYAQRVDTRDAERKAERQAEEQRRAEEKRLAEAQKLVEARLAEERKVEEARLAEAQKAEEARLVEERKTEEARLIEARKDGETQLADAQQALEKRLTEARKGEDEEKKRVAIANKKQEGTREDNSPRKLKDINFSRPYECQDHLYSRRQDRVIEKCELHKPKIVKYGSSLQSVLPTLGQWSKLEEKQYPLVNVYVVANPNGNWGTIIELREPKHDWKNTCVYLSHDLPLLQFRRFYRIHFIDAEEPGLVWKGKIHLEDDAGRVFQLTAR